MIQKITLCAVLLGIFAIAGNAQNNQTDSQTQKEVRTRANRATQQSTQSNEQLTQPKRVEDSYPLDKASREKSIKILQQTTVDLLSLFNMYKEAHWNVNGPLYLPLHDIIKDRRTLIADRRTFSPNVRSNSASALTGVTARSAKRPTSRIFPPVG